MSNHKFKVGDRVHCDELDDGGGFIPNEEKLWGLANPIWLNNIK